MEAQLCWLEVSINDAWRAHKQPRIPVSTGEIIAEGIACAQAGAAIIRVQACDQATGAAQDSADLYAAIIEGIRHGHDALVYPALGMRDQAPAQRLALMEELARRGLLEWAPVTPGSANFAHYDDLREDREEGFVDVNTDQTLRQALRLASRYRFHPAYAIHEPGFMRLGATLHWRCSSPTPVYRLMFSSDYTVGFPPDDFSLTAYLNLLDRVAPGARWMVAGYGANIRTLIPRAVSEGGHVSVGAGTEESTNLRLVQEAVEIIRGSGAEIATATQVRADLEAVEMGE